MTALRPGGDDGPHHSRPAAHQQLVVVATPGPGTAIVNAPIVIVVDAPATDPLVTDLIAPVLAQAGLTGVIRQFALHHLDQIPGFVCIAAESDSVRLLVRAPLTVQVTNGADTVTFDGEGRSTWHEVSVPYSDLLQITLPSATLDPSPGQANAGQQIEVGVMPMGSVTISFAEALVTTTELSPEPTPGDPASHEPTLASKAPGAQDTRDARDARPVSTETERTGNDLPDTSPPPATPAGAAPRTPSVAAQDGQTAGPPVPAPPDRLEGDEGDHEAAVHPGPPAAAAAPEPDAHPDLDLVHLFEETTYRPAAPAPADAEVKVQAPAEAASDEVEPNPHVRTPVVGAPATPPAPGPKSEQSEVERVSPPTVIPATVITPKPPAGTLISSVPGMGQGVHGPPAATHPGPSPSTDAERVAPSPTPTPPPTPVAAAQDAVDDPGDDLDDVTISAAALRRMLEQRAQAERRSPGAMLAAIFCPNGHPNPTHQDTCRACDQAITNRAATTIDRPVLGQLVFDTGLVVDVDQHLLIGRRPPGDQKVNDEPTRAVQLEDPEHLMSRTHLMVQLDGWQVLVVDRDSMNHTFVEVPGRAAFQLRPGEPYPIPPGTVVRLGEEASFTYDTRVR